MTGVEHSMARRCCSGSYSVIEASHVIVRSLRTLQAALRKYRTLRHTSLRVESA